jgi:hypothetical protein
VSGGGERLCEHGAMSRLAAVALGLASIALLAGCVSSTTSVLPAVAAPPQQAELDWVERSPDTGPGLVFRVHRFAVTESGWDADVEIENRTAATWEIARDRLAVAQSFGIMLFATGDLGEVERRSRDGELPGLRPARSFVPSVPASLAPGERWRGTISARGRLAAGRWVRVVFGPLIADGDAPRGMPTHFVWITDHAHRLRLVAGREPAGTTQD